MSHQMSVKMVNMLSWNSQTLNAVAPVMLVSVEYLDLCIVTAETSSVVLVCCLVDAGAGPWVPLLWLRVCLCYHVHSVQDPASHSPHFGSLCWVILGNMSWIPFRWMQSWRCWAGAPTSCSWVCNTPLRRLSLQMAVSFFTFLFLSFLPVTSLPSVLLLCVLSSYFSFPSLLVCHHLSPRTLLPAVRSQSLEVI